MLPPCNVNYILHFCLCQVYIAYLIYTLLLQLFCPFYERAMQIVNIISIQHFGCFTIILTRTGFYVNYESFADRMGNCSVIWACYHYCDSVGFKELPDFQKENYLKAAEMSTEDDYGMIDGIINNGKQPSVADLEQQAKSGQPISLMDLADAAHQEKKASVLEKLKDQPQQPRRKSKPRKSKEQEI